MDNIAYDQAQKFPLPSDNKVWGEVNTRIIFTDNVTL